MSGLIEMRKMRVPPPETFRRSRMQSRRFHPGVLFLGNNLSLSRGIGCSSSTPSDVWGSNVRSSSNGPLDPDLEEICKCWGEVVIRIDQSKSSRITLKRKSAPSDHHETDLLPIGPPPSSSSIAPVPSLRHWAKRPSSFAGTPLFSFRLSSDRKYAGLLSTLCPSEGSCSILYSTCFGDDPVIIKECSVGWAGWGYHKEKRGCNKTCIAHWRLPFRMTGKRSCAVLPDDLTPPGSQNPFRQAFKTSSIDPSATSSMQSRSLTAFALL
nr:hypothetical protein Iba_chr05eCG14000 [Ipomoea batatas]